jgi:hypothetical protein
MHPSLAVWEGLLLLPHRRCLINTTTCDGRDCHTHKRHKAVFLSWAISTRRTTACQEHGDAEFMALGNPAKEVTPSPTRCTQEKGGHATRTPNGISESNLAEHATHTTNVFAHATRKLKCSKCVNRSCKCNSCVMFTRRSMIGNYTSALSSSKFPNSVSLPFAVIDPSRLRAITRRRSVDRSIPFFNTPSDRK